MWLKNRDREMEVKKYYLLAKMQIGGLDLNRIKSLTPIDFLKIETIKEFL